MKKVFLTFATSEYVGTATRLYFRAMETGWFDDVIVANDSVVPENLRHRLSEPFHGWYFWKPIAIYNQLIKMESGDVLVYADAGCDINLSGWHFFEDKLKFLKKSLIVGIGWTYLNQFCSSEILADFSISDDVARKKEAIQANVLYIKKTEESVVIIKEWMDYMINNPDKIKMNFNDKGKLDGFVQNRCDQSVLGCLSIKHKEKFRIIRADISWIYNCKQSLFGSELRSMEYDVVPARKVFDYKPYVMFVIGQEFPIFEKQYDEYTHFLNVGKNDLHRCTDKTGDNVGKYKGMAEQTGIYWIWKNVDLSNVKYVGISTHRKPFFMSNQNMYDIMESGYDAICVKIQQNRFDTERASFSDELAKDLFNTFKKHYPNLFEEFMQFEKSGIFYPNNSFVVKTETFKALCEFIFPVTIDVASRYEGVEGKHIACAEAHSPVAGIFGEDVTAFFLHKFCQKKAFCPIVMYPKGEGLFRCENSSYSGDVAAMYKNWTFGYPNPRQQFGILGGERKPEFNASFYPNWFNCDLWPNIIQSDSVLKLIKELDSGKTPKVVMIRKNKKSEQKSGLFIPNGFELTPTLKPAPVYDKPFDQIKWD